MRADCTPRWRRLASFSAPPPRRRHPLTATAVSTANRPIQIACRAPPPPPLRPRWPAVAASAVLRSSCLPLMHFFTPPSSMPRRPRPHSFLPRKRRDHQPQPHPPPQPQPKPHHSPSPEAPPPSPPFSHSSANVTVADFVHAPPHRFADDSFPPEHKLTQPPPFDLFIAAQRNSRHADSPTTVVTKPQYFGAVPYAPQPDAADQSSSDESAESIDSNVYVIDNSHHLSNLLNIVAPPKHHCEEAAAPSGSPPPSTPRRSFRVVPHSALPATAHISSDDTDLHEGHLEHLRFEDASSDQSASLSPELASERDEVSSTSITNMQPIFRPCAQFAHSHHLLPAPRLNERAKSETSTSSKSSIHPLSADACTVGLVESSDDLFRCASRCHSPLIRRVESWYSADDALHPGRNLLCQNPPSPAKYTFKPAHRRSSPHVSSPSSRLSLHAAVRTFSAQRHTEPINPQLSAQQVCHRKSYSFSSLSSQANSEPLTLAAIKKAVDIIDPRVFFSIAQSQSLAFAAAGLFRKKRDSEETFNSASTEYYEDDYTRFLEKKHCLSPSRLIQRPCISRMRSPDGWFLRSPKLELRSDSTLSLPSSDEEYFSSS